MTLLVHDTTCSEKKIYDLFHSNDNFIYEFETSMSRCCSFSKRSYTIENKATKLIKCCGLSLSFNQRARLNFKKKFLELRQITKNCNISESYNYGKEQIINSENTYFRKLASIAHGTRPYF